MRINKLLSNYGYCSRKKANEIIRENRILVNGEPAIEGQWVEEYDEIILDGKAIEKKERIYIAFNKPVGVTCTAAQEVKDNIVDFINYGEYIFPVGRLDKMSQGLIILTNDGDFADHILNAENNHEKEYIVRVHKEFDDEFLKRLSGGVDLGDKVTKKCKVFRENKDTFRIILTEGINRQIRRMTKAFGYNVVYLNRIRIMNIKLEGIEEGRWRSLSPREIEEV